MSVSISNLAYSLRLASANSIHHIGLSHAQQLIAAALGYQSLAAYQANSEECKFIENGMHIILNNELLLSRATGFGMPFDASSLATLLSQAFHKALPEARLHRSAAEFGDELNELVQLHVVNDGLVSSQTAMTNHDGIKDVYFEVYLSQEDLPAIGEFLELPVTGHVNMEIDIERPYSGHHVDIDVMVTAERLGLSIIGQPTIEVTKAKLDFGWHPDYDAEEDARVSFAQALADELGLSLAEAEQLTEVEEMALTGMTGDMTYSYLFDFTEIAPPDIAAKIIAKYGTLEVEVTVNFFDRVQRSFD